MKYIEAPEEYRGKGTTLFLTGSITGAFDWQAELADLLKGEDIVILNPRRKKFVMNDPSLEENQISWEHEHLKSANAISFWFSHATLAPITLFELGAWSMAGKKIFIGIDQEYTRKRDIEIQMRLARPEVKIVYDITSLSGLIKEWAREK